MRKGFIHIVEIIVIVIAMLFILTQFSFIPRIAMDFDRSSQFLEANDLVYTLNALGIDWFNATSVNQSLYAVLPATARYSLEIRNTIPSSMEIACICNTTEVTQLREILDDFTLNDRVISFNITHMNNRLVDNVTGAFSLKYDVVFIGPDIFENPGTGINGNLSEYIDRMRAYLRNDRGIVELRDIDTEAGLMEIVQEEIFGLVRDESVTPSSEELIFTRHIKSNITDGSLQTYPNRTFFSIFKNYYMIPIFNESFQSANRWNPVNGTWIIDDGFYNVSCPSSDGDCYSLTSDSQGDNYAVEAWMYMRSGFYGGIGFRQQDVDNGIWFIINETSGEFFFAHRSGGSWYYSLTQPIPNTTWTPEAWYKIRIEAPNAPIIYNDEYKAEVFNASGMLVASLYSEQDMTGFGSGGVGLYCSAAGDGEAAFDSVRVVPMEPERFPDILHDNEKIGQPGGGEHRMIVMQPDSGAPGAVINTNVVNASGRTAWISAGSDDEQDKQRLIRDLIVWAAGDEMTVVEETVRNPLIISFFKVLNKDSLELVEVVLSIGTVF